MVERRGKGKKGAEGRREEVGFHICNMRKVWEPAPTEVRKTV